MDSSNLIGGHTKEDNKNIIKRRRKEHLKKRLFINESFPSIFRVVISGDSIILKFRYLCNFHFSSSNKEHIIKHTLFKVVMKLRVLLGYFFFLSKLVKIWMGIDPSLFLRFNFVIFGYQGPYPIYIYI